MVIIFVVVLLVVRLFAVDADDADFTAAECWLQHNVTDTHCSL